MELQLQIRRFLIPKHCPKIGLSSVLFFLVLHIVCGDQEVRLLGSTTSFAKYPTWFPCQNGSIAFEFKTHQIDALLLYTDDGNNRDFLQVKLVSGNLRMRLSIANHSTTMSAGATLGDNQWHNVEIRRRYHETSFTLDRVSQSKPHIGSNLNFGQESKGNSYVFIGGLPIGYKARLSLLAAPTVMLEPRFRGTIRSLRYSQCGGQREMVEMVDYEGLKTNFNDACAQNDPCTASGRCVPTDTGLFCDCQTVGFAGEFCEIEVPPDIVTFYGREYLKYGLQEAREPLLSSKDHVFMRFKTSRANGFLFHTGAGSDQMTLWLEDEGLHLSVTLGSRQSRVSVDAKAANISFDDNEWHSISIQRQARELTANKGICDITISVDARVPYSGTVFGDFTLLSSQHLYVGAVPKNSQLEASLEKSHPTFRGCLAEVFYQADSIRFELIRLARHQPDLINVHGNPVFGRCDDAENSPPVSLLTENSFITVPNKTLSESSTIEFSFITKEPSGVLVYSISDSNPRKLFVLEIYEGTMTFLIDSGNGPVSITFSEIRDVSDGILHSVILQHNGKEGEIQLDEYSHTYSLNKRSDIFLMGQQLIFGGRDLSMIAYDNMWHLYAPSMNHGFVGCLQDFYINDEAINLAQLAKSQPSNGIGDQCRGVNGRPSTPHCASLPCMHQGTCIDGWNRYICDCSNTPFGGRNCDKDATTVRFNGQQYVRLTLPIEQQTQTEQFSLRFRTQRSNGLLFLTTASNNSDDRLCLALDGGKIRLDLHIGTHFQTVYVGQGVNDDQWHNVLVRRRHKRLFLEVDGTASDKNKITHRVPVIMHIRDVHLGAVSNDDKADINHFPVDPSIPADDISKRNRRGPENFQGEMQHFIFNRRDYFELPVKPGVNNHSGVSLDTNAEYLQNDELVNDAITFNSQAAYLIIKYVIKRTFSIYVHVRTIQPNGLILYSGRGNSNDFMVLELSDGRIRYIFDVGNGPQAVESNAEIRINDNRWHRIDIIRSSLKQHMLRVDDSAYYYNMGDTTTFDLDTDPDFYIGGASERIFSYLPDKVHSRVGYQGCIGSIDLDSNMHDVIQERVKTGEQFEGQITPGCQGPTKECEEDSCYNNGVCIQQWDTYTCDCSVTSFTGSKCDRDGTAYRFGEEGGVLRFSLQDSEQDRRTDNLALGMRTTQLDAVLLRVNSGDYNDYIEMEIVDGYVYVMYNLGTDDHIIGQTFETVSDGQYHVIRFTRNGPNSTLQIDNGIVQTKNPTDWDPSIKPIDSEGHQWNIFNKQSDVFIGGRKDRAGIMRPYNGTISGFVFNNMPLLDYARDGDPRISTEGAVHLDLTHAYLGLRSTTISPTNVSTTTPAVTPQLVSPTRSRPTDDRNKTDDLISSGATGCEPQLGAECREDVDTTDRLIVPRTKPAKTTTTVLPITTPPISTTTELSGVGPCDDEEDCLFGSGDDSSELDEQTIHPAPDFTFTDKDTKPFVEVNPDIVDEIQIEENQDKTTKKAPTVEIVSKGKFPSDIDDVEKDKTTIKIVDPGANDATPKDPQDSREKNSPWSLNLGLIIGIAVGIVLLLLLLAYVLYKYRSRDEGTYKIDETKNYRYESVSTKVPSQTNASNGVAKAQTDCAKANKKKGTVKEWYV